ncbi:sphingomyelin phosphodiesterase 1-like [Macrosteles quadrilineatus]|uniref:sphingomyelin phosphodiesterase 1-like n=1 Tax=Macrosteles quadrilineatus TaxID=74068 RepID=UPI0023E2FE90|nr:sphingomyelin phosphodiesterase 1-like [Macrosteles quadrilineatus]
MLFLTILVFGYISSTQQEPLNPNGHDIIEQLLNAVMQAFKNLTSATEADLESLAIPLEGETLCITCRALFDFFITAYKLQLPDPVLRALLVRLCTSLFTESVCQGVVDLNVPVFIEIGKRKPDLNSYQICGTVFEQYCNREEPVVEWSLDIPEKNETNQTNNSTSKQSKDANSAQDIIEICHVTDTHVDRKYAAGAKSTSCREPICCRYYQGEPEPGEEPAGTWGSYPSCDIPRSSAEDALTVAAANNEKPPRQVVGGVGCRVTSPGCLAQRFCIGSPLVCLHLLR